MADNYTPRVKALLRQSGCTIVRQGKGDHEIWHSPITNRRLMVDQHIKSCRWANYTGYPSERLSAVMPAKAGIH